MDWRHRARSEAVRDAFVEKDEGDPDLPAHGKSSGLSGVFQTLMNRGHLPRVRRIGRSPEKPTTGMASCCARAASGHAAAAPPTSAMNSPRLMGLTPRP